MRRRPDRETASGIPPLLASGSASRTRLVQDGPVRGKGWVQDRASLRGNQEAFPIGDGAVASINGAKTVRLPTLHSHTDTSTAARHRQAMRTGGHGRRKRDVEGRGLHRYCRRVNDARTEHAGVLRMPTWATPFRRKSKWGDSRPDGSHLRDEPQNAPSIRVPDRLSLHG